VEAQIWKKPKDVRQGRFTLGDGVSKLNPGHSIDAFVFIGAFGSLTTNGEKVRRMMAGPTYAARELVDIQVSVADAPICSGHSDFLSGVPDQFAGIAPILQDVKERRRAPGAAYPSPPWLRGRHAVCVELPRDSLERVPAGVEFKNQAHGGGLGLVHFQSGSSVLTSDRSVTEHPAAGL